MMINGYVPLNNILVQNLIFLFILKHISIQDQQSQAHSDSSDDCRNDGHVEYAVLLPDSFAVLDVT